MCIYYAYNMYILRSADDAPRAEAHRSGSQPEDQHDDQGEAERGRARERAPQGQHRASPLRRGALMQADDSTQPRCKPSLSSVEVKLNYDWLSVVFQLNSS